MCEYCQGGKKLPSQDINKKYDLNQYPDSGIKAIVDRPSKSMWLSAFCNANEIPRLKGNNNGVSDVVDINYCPMCGDELGKEANRKNEPTLFLDKINDPMARIPYRVTYEGKDITGEVSHITYDRFSQINSREKDQLTVETRRATLRFWGDEFEVRQRIKE